MNLRVLVAYRWFFSTAFVAPLAFIFERKKRPKFTWMILVQAFLSGLFGLEKLRLRTTVGKAKVFGLSIGIGGAMLLTFYKGVEIKIWSTNVRLLKHSHQIQASHFTGNYILGSAMALGSCLSFALWLILQTKISKEYPCPYSSTALMSLMGSIQCVTLALCLEEIGANGSWDGILGSLQLLIRGLCLLGNSILGAALVVCGQYLLLWGQSKELKEKAQLIPTTNGSPRTESVEVVAEGDPPALNASFTHEEASLSKERKNEQK
ncbi:hypothetical protein GH714_017944 [Hevea brasiliensis]|uniref:WAT1-related protein n=1 Tax=Hevea brasiliensis TaxID=3981 RepID=A0A6A6N5A2_HEVBR|nr:hypothetical protein GH714_017944 [Hevea brasiliensis]